MLMARILVICEGEIMAVTLAFFTAAIDKKIFPREESPTPC